MFKSKPLLMLITGVVMAVVLWGVVQVVQNKPSQISATTPDDITEKNTPLPVQYTNAPASILSAVQTGSIFTLEGIGVPGAGLTLQYLSQDVVRTKVNAEGMWAVSFTYDWANESMLLNLLMVTPDGHQIRSDQLLFIVVNPHSLDTSATPNNTSKALLLLTAPGANSRVMQTPYSSLPSKEGFEIEAIDYDNSGGVIFSGSSRRAGKVRIYAGENLVGESRVDSAGRWSLIFGNIMPLGEYKISAELVITDGKIVRLTLPFARMKPMFEVENSPKILIEHLDDRIQIGRALFGGGYQYTVVYAPIALEE